MAMSRARWLGHTNPDTTENRIILANGWGDHCLHAQSGLKYVFGPPSEASWFCCADHDWHDRRLLGRNVDCKGQKVATLALH